MPGPLAVLLEVLLISAISIVGDMLLGTDRVTSMLAYLTLRLLFLCAKLREKRVI